MTSPDAVRSLLELAGRFDKPLSKGALQGITNYLKLGGTPETLRRAAVWRNYRDFVPEAQLHAENVLNNLATWDRPAVQGLEFMLNEVRQRTPTTSDARGDLVKLFGDVHPDLIRGAMPAVTVLAPRSRGWGRALDGLLSGDPYKERGGVGTLFSAVELAKRYPDTIISFEVPTPTPEGFGRVQDIAVIRRGTATTPEIILLYFEIKEVSTGQLGRRVPHQFAIDIRLDIESRREQAAAGTAVGERLGSFRWRVRKLELRRTALQQLVREGTAHPSENEITGRMIDSVRNQLRNAFRDPALSTIDPLELQAYQDAFDSITAARTLFLEFF